jgi:hypothetical protein
MLSKINAVMHYRDSFTEYCVQYGREHLTREEYDGWQDKRGVEAAQHEFQLFISPRERELQEYVQTLH